ncbi:hypothetical protein BC831DRAFT_484311 [Entophlyctis helioformis]|nr:hypothetical protein BC831DRAFT_484311 [Entophlyctis helioformis]
MATIAQPTVVPLIVLGVEKGRLPVNGMALMQDIVDSRGILRKDKNSYLAIVGLADATGTLSPKRRVPARIMLTVASGMPDDSMVQILSLKSRGDNFDVEEGYNQEPDQILAAVVRQCVQPGTVIVDLMPKSREADTLIALKAAAELGCSVVLPLPRPAEYKDACLAAFGAERATVFAKPPSIRKLVYSLVESHAANPRKLDPIPEHLVKGARQPLPHVHGPNCSHGPLPGETSGHDHGHDHGHSHSHAHEQKQEHVHVHGPNCNHDHGHGHEHGHGHGHGHSHDEHEHVHGPNCNHEPSQEEQERMEQQLQELTMEVLADVDAAVNAIKVGNMRTINAVTWLCMYGPNPPEVTRLPDGTLPDEGFGHLFAAKGLHTILINNARSLIKSGKTTQRFTQLLITLLNCLLSMIQPYPEESGGDDICAALLEAGCISMIRMATTVVVAGKTEPLLVPGSGVLRHPHPSVRELGLDILVRMQEAHLLFRECDGCGKVEEKMESWKACGRCRYCAYCSKECQVADWKRGHKNVCSLIEPGAMPAPLPVSAPAPVVADAASAQ